MNEAGRAADAAREVNGAVVACAWRIVIFPARRHVTMFHALFCFNSRLSASNWMLLILKGPRVRRHFGEPQHETVRLIEGAGGRAVFFRADIRDEQQVRGLIAFAEQTYGRVTVLVNNASGPFRPGYETEYWADTVQTEFLGALYATRHAIEAMRRSGGGAIVNIASISGLWHGRRFPGGAPAYDAAKVAMIRLTTSLEGLTAKDGIRVNCLAPGWIATDEPRQHWESLTPTQRIERGVPSRLLSVDDVSNATIHLATDRTLAGRVLLLWSEDHPRLIRRGDRGYKDADEIVFQSAS